LDKNNAKQLVAAFARHRQCVEEWLADESDIDGDEGMT
jgi:hypothetical protein